MVRSTLALIAAMAFASTLATPALAKTDESTFKKLIAKYAVDVTNGIPVPLKPKAACVCTASLPATPGFLEIHTSLNQVYCGLPAFDSNGKVLVITACQQFQVLAK
jgi:hypothetical protein